MSEFKLSYDGVGELLCSSMVEAEMLRRALLVAERARQTAVVAKTGRHRGRYKASFRASAGVRQLKTRRAVGRVSNSAPEGYLVEKGSKNNPARHTLALALQAARG